MPRRVLILVAVLGTAACSGAGGPVAEMVVVDTLANGAVHVTSPAEGVWDLTGARPWELVEELRIGVLDGDERYMFARPRNVIPDDLGRIWVLDGYEMRLFDRDGTFVRTIGGEGDGPGEFGFNPCASAGPDGEVWVESGGRWQRFDSAGALLGGQQVTRSLGCGVVGWRPDGQFLTASNLYDAESRERTSVYLVHEREPSGDVMVTDTLYPIEVADYQSVSWLDGEGRPRITSVVPLTHRPTRSLGPHGDFWISQGDGSYVITRQGTYGDTTLIFERPYDPIPVPDSLRRAAIDGLRREGLRLDPAFDTDQIPTVFAPFERLIPATDGTLWVQRRLEGGAFGLDVFSADGRFLGPVVVPDDLDHMSIHLITPDYVYGTVADEFDVRSIVRLGIVKGQGAPDD